MDQHLLIRYAYGGLVLLLFFTAGFWIIDDQTVASLLTSKEVGDLRAMVGIGAAAPIIGVTIHGIVVSVHHLWGKGHSFSDNARRSVAEAFRKTAADMLPEGGQGLEALALKLSLHDIPPRKARLRLRDRIGKWPGGGGPTERPLPDDSIFVLLYYHYEVPHLIEWARRRRSYHLLGQSWCLAAMSGLVFGLISGRAYDSAMSRVVALAGGDKLILSSLMIVATVIWSFGAWWLGFEMKNDADAMEWVWARGFLQGGALKHADTTQGSKPGHLH